MKIFLGTWLLVQYFQCHALISDSQKCLIPCKGEMNVLNLTITCFDYIITNDGSQNKLQSFSPVSSSKLSQRPALTPNTVRSKLHVNKWFLSFALNITTCDARLKKQSGMSCITEEMNGKKSCDSSANFSFLLNCCALLPLLALEQTMNRDITVLIRSCSCS